GFHGAGSTSHSRARPSSSASARGTCEARGTALRRRLGEGPLRNGGDDAVHLVRPRCARVPDRGTWSCRPGGDRIHVPPTGRPNRRRVERFLRRPDARGPAHVSRSLWESTDPKSVEGWYLNLYTWDRYEREWGDWHPTPTTISSNLFYAFHRALKLLREEGLEARFARHAKVAAQLRAGLAELG